MNLFVADPHWGWWVIFYFFLGGIAAGAYFLAVLMDVIGDAGDRELARVGYWIAFPLVPVCGILLILDLDRPERFWHMLFRSEVVHNALDAGWPWSVDAWSRMLDAPLLKYWSPMSIGSWALLLFGVCTALSFFGSLWSQGRMSWLLRRSFFGLLLKVVGCAVGFFVASYTGALLTATNQPVWSDTNWVAPLFLTSAASTGIAAMLLVGRSRPAIPAQTWDRLERADLWALALEAVALAAFLVSLGDLLVPVLATFSGKLFAATPLVGLLVPFALHVRAGVAGRRAAVAAAVLVLLGGFLLRYSIVTIPSELLRLGPAASAGLSPEDGRAVGERGADPMNRPAELTPRSRVFDEP